MNCGLVLLCLALFAAAVEGRSAAKGVDFSKVSDYYKILGVHKGVDERKLKRTYRCCCILFEAC